MRAADYHAGSGGGKGNVGPTGTARTFAFTRIAHSNRCARRRRRGNGKRRILPFKAGVIQGNIRALREGAILDGDLLFIAPKLKS